MSIVLAVTFTLCAVLMFPDGNPLIWVCMIITAALAIRYLIRAAALYTTTILQRRTAAHTPDQREPQQ